MPMTKTAITMDQDMTAALRERERHGDDETSRSEQIRTIIARYVELCRRDRPALSDAEWNLVRDALNGVWLREPSSLSVAWAEVADGIRLNRLDEKWGVDGPELVERLRALTYGQVLALVDDVERFWAASSR